MKDIYLDYTNFVNIVISSKDLPYQYTLSLTGDIKKYKLFAVDESLYYECTINSRDEASEVSNFESNYLTGANRRLSQIFRFESDTGRQDVRIRQVNGDLRRTFIYFIPTSTGSLDAGEEDYYYISCPDSTHTCIDFLPEYDYSLTGGMVELLSEPLGLIKVSFIMAPNIPAEYGGNWPIVKNKKLLVAGKPYTERVDSKFFKYIPGMPEASRTRLLVEHVAGEYAEIEFCLDVFI